jgi:peptidoglycan/LPS O-acetylase OafA/YrhL
LLPTSKYRLNTIQSLRGFAAVAVLLFHLEPATTKDFGHHFMSFSYGYLGVDFFFVLSGFIITLIHLKDIESRGSVRSFLRKRFNRIFPFYWVTFLFFLAIEYPDFQFKPSLKTALDPHTSYGISTLVKSIFLLPLNANRMLIYVTWTLTYELAFYSIFAIAIWKGWKGVRIILPIWLLFIFINSRSLLPKTDFIQIFGGTLNIEFLFGCLAAYLFLKAEKRMTLKMFLGFIAVLTLMFAAYLSWHSFNRDALGMTIILAATASAIILYGATLDTTRRTWLAAPLLVLIGDASYSIYLTHTMYIDYFTRAIASLFHVSGLQNWQKNIFTILVAIICIAAGVLIHLLLERPILKKLNSKNVAA